MSTTPARQKIIVIVGPTSAGKSDFAVALALKFNGEIISADSRQVYRGVGLLTGTISEVETCGIAHHLLGIRSLSDPYSVTDFVIDATKCIENITARGKVPILCGGTAMYIDALIYNQIFPKVAKNEILRETLSQKTVSELYQTLKELDPVRASTIDTQNPRRLVRAIEIATELGSVPAITHEDGVYETLLIGLHLPKPELDARIKQRISKRMTCGMPSEILALHESGLDYNYIKTFGLEFNWITQIVTGETDEKTALEKLYFDTIHYAKRQLTWWKRNPDIHWISPQDILKAESLIETFLQK